jgi:hypothetical protein
MQPVLVDRSKTVERTLHPRPKSGKGGRTSLAVSKEVHARIRKAADEQKCVLESLTAKLILDGLDKLSADQMPRSA